MNKQKIIDEVLENIEDSKKDEFVSDYYPFLVGIIEEELKVRLGISGEKK